MLCSACACKGFPHTVKALLQVQHGKNSTRQSQLLQDHASKQYYASIIYFKNYETYYLNSLKLSNRAVRDECELQFKCSARNAIVMAVDRDLIDFSIGNL